MKYWLLDLGEEKYWYELDDEGYANRQIVLDEHNQLHVSCLEDCLAEDPINEADIECGIIILSKREFDILWHDILKKYEKLWKMTKKKYPIGFNVQGVISYFYPQGTIIKGNDFIAIYEGKDLFCLNKSVQYTVKSYDDTNMWLVLE